MLRQTLFLVLVGIVFVYTETTTSRCGLSGVITGRCNETQIKTCTNATLQYLPWCRLNNTPIVYANCCLSCKPIACNSLPVCDFSKIFLCDGVAPTYTNGCPSCILRPPMCNCTVPFTTIRTCASGETPTRDYTTCCPTCVDRYDTCLNMTVRTTCDATRASLPTCTSSDLSVFDKSSCCISGCICNRSIDTNPNCNRTDFLQCMEKRNGCALGEIPCADPTSCCPSCRRIYWLARAEQIAKCIILRRECNADEIPIRLADDICPLCHVRKPHCNFTCGSNETCAFRWDVMNDVPRLPLEQKCVRRALVRIRITAAINTVLDNIRLLGREGVRHLILQYIHRFCDIPANTENCREWAENFRNLEVTDFDVNTNTITISIPDDPLSTVTGGKRYFLYSSPSSILSSSVQDNTATGDVTFDIPPSGPSSQPTGQPTQSTGQPTQPTGQQPTATNASAHVCASVLLILALMSSLF